MNRFLSRTNKVGYRNIIYSKCYDINIKYMYIKNALYDNSWGLESRLEWKAERGARWISSVDIAIGVHYKSRTLRPADISRSSRLVEIE